MIAWKLILPTSLTAINQIDDRTVGNSGSQEVSGYIYDATTFTGATAFQTRLPQVSLSEGKVIIATCINPTNKAIRFIKNALDTSTSIGIVLDSVLRTSTITCATDGAQLFMFCDGNKWWAYNDGTWS